MSNFNVLPMDESCLQGVLEISNLCFSISWSLESLRGELKNEFAKYVIIKKDDVIVGYGGIWIIYDEAQVTNIAVHPSYRGLHIGDLIVESLFEVCKKAHITAMTLEVRESNLIAQNLYKKYGFTTEGIRKNYYEDNHENALIMWNKNI